jgi:hypothetical protein
MDMFSFVLGLLLGLGILPAVAELKHLNNNRNARKAAALQRLIDAEIARREADAWGIVRSPHTTGVDLTPDTDWSK